MAGPVLLLAPCAQVLVERLSTPGHLIHARHLRMSYIFSSLLTLPCCAGYSSRQPTVTRTTAAAAAAGLVIVPVNQLGPFSFSFLNFFFRILSLRIHSAVSYTIEINCLNTDYCLSACPASRLHHRKVVDSGNVGMHWPTARYLSFFLAARNSDDAKFDIFIFRRGAERKAFPPLMSPDNTWASFLFSSSS